MSKMNLTAWKVLSHKALNKNLPELVMQKRMDTEELASRNERPGTGLEAATESIERAMKDIPEYEIRKRTKCGTAKEESITGSGGSAKYNGILLVRSKTQKRGKEE